MVAVFLYINRVEFACIYLNLIYFSALAENELNSIPVN